MRRLEARTHVHDLENARTLGAMRRCYQRLIELLPNWVRIDADRQSGAITNDLMSFTSAQLPDD